MSEGRDSPGKFTGCDLLVKPVTSPRLNLTVWATKELKLTLQCYIFTTKAC